MVYPLLLRPIFKGGLYCGNTLNRYFGVEGENIGEALLLCLDDTDENVVKNGAFAGLTLRDVLLKWGKDAVGKNVSFNGKLPFKVKFIDSKDRQPLSVEYGGNETFYIISAEETSRMVYGINKNITREELSHRTKNNSIFEICRFVLPKTDDSFCISSGELSALGRDIFALCVCDTDSKSFYITDYGRIGKDGCSLELQTEKAVSFAALTPSEEYGSIGEITLYPFGIVKELDTCGTFCTEFLKLNGKAAMLEKDSFISLSLLSGEAVLSYPTGNMRLKKGDSVFIPANTRITLTGKADAITVHAKANS